MRAPAREELAWIAGIHCGEGSITTFSDGRRLDGKRWLGLRFTVGQTSDSEQHPPEMLVRIREFLKAGRIWRLRTDTRNGGTRRPHFQYCLSGFKPTQALIAMMWEWLTPEKKEQAERALKTWRASYAERIG